MVDDDTFLEHNLARHVLFENAIGKNKAEFITKELSSLFRGFDDQDYLSFDNSVLYIDKENYTNYNWLVDTTASKQVSNFIVQQAFPPKINIAKCALVDEGRMGVLYIEGARRNPRLDDLMNLTHYLAVRNKDIEAWRKADENRQVKTLDIGLGCSSSTTVIADDTISFHSSLFSKLLYRVQNRTEIGDKGLLFRSILGTGVLPAAKTEFDLIDPFEIYDCQAASGWQIRLLGGLSAQFFHFCKKRGRRETGGVVVGVANYKTKTIHIFQIIAEPKGSKGTFSWFVRGSVGLPEQIDSIKERTGQVIGYIGEWHTHPMNLQGLSQTDLGTINRLLPANRKTPIPTLSLIVTPDRILPFVFE